MTHPPLARRLGTGDAVVLGLGSMLGAGVFAAFAPAAGAAGAGLLLALAVAAFVALCNAAASAQLAAQCPSSGGSYLYGRRRLGPWWGFVAGWGFVVGKTASCAAMASTAAAYAVPEPARRPVAVGAVLVLAAVSSRGITRTAQVTRVLLGAVLACLAAAPAPLAATVTAAGWDGAAAPVRIGAVAASLGALLALMTGVGRTALAMAREGDLPRGLAAVGPRHAVPRRAQLAVTGAVCALVAAADLRTAIAASSFGVLVYYLVANAAAWTQPPRWRRFPRGLQVAGVAGCAVLALSLPVEAVVGGSVVLLAGVLLRVLLRRGEPTSTAAGRAGAP